ncbi:MAG TPA: carboxypeptidase regulatory-like domain-containing protein, partial [Calditrichia bacterium]|nr:carboxypeptidase regulatory-like domain-containing protein [Calditrichia bacterium]
MWGNLYLFTVKKAGSEAGLLLRWTVWVTVFFSTIVCSQTTGKLAGLITDTKGNPLIAANVSLDDTQMGATSDLDGYYLILNLRSGTYTIRVAYLGDQTKVVENVRISADQTTQ